MSDGPSTPKRVRLDNDEILNLTPKELIEKFQEQNEYVRYLESKTSLTGDDDDGQESEGKIRQHILEGKRENTLVLRLASKEQELQDCLNQISEMKQAHTQNTAQLRSMMLDPALNIIFQRMSKEVDDCKDKLKQTQNELSAWKFTPDSQTGKRLMAKCRMLLQENEELGKMITSGRTAKLEGEIALQKTLVQEMKKNQQELDEFVGELEEDVEGMQCMIYLLQTQLKDTKEQLAKITAENELLMNRKMSSDHDPGGTEKNVHMDIKPSPTKPVILQNSGKDTLTVSENCSENGQVLREDVREEHTENLQDKEPMEIETHDPVQTHILTADSTSHMESTSTPAKSCSSEHSKMDASDSKDSSETSPQTSKKDTNVWHTQHQDDSIHGDTESCSPSNFKDCEDLSLGHGEQDTKDISPKCPAQDNVSPRHSTQGSLSPRHSTQGSLSPRHSTQGSLSPRHSTQDSLSPRHSAHGNLSPRHSTQGSLSPRHSTQGSLSPRHSTQGSLSPRHSTHSNLSPRHSTQGSLSPRHSTQGDLSPRHSTQGSLSPRHSTQGNLSPRHSTQGNLSPRHSTQGNLSPRHSTHGNSYSPKQLANDTRSWSPDNSGAMDLSNCRQSPEDAGGRNSVRDRSPRRSDKPCDVDWSPDNSTKQVDGCSPPNRTKDPDDTTAGNPKTDPDIISVEDKNNRTDSKPDIVTDSTPAQTDAGKAIHVPNGVEPLTQSEGDVD